jgi:hypothetical protein
MNVTVFGMMTTAWQGNGLTVGLDEGLKEGLVGLAVGEVDGLATGTLEGAVDGRRVTTGAVVEEATGDGVQKIRPVKQVSPAAHSVLEPLGQAR